MPRRQSCRRVRFFPPSLVFRPASIARAAPAPEIVLGLDQLEAMRLVYVEGLDHVNAARRMEVSRATFSRIVRQACVTVTRVLVEGSALRVDGQVSCPAPCTCESDRAGARSPRTPAATPPQTSSGEA